MSPRLLAAGATLARVKERSRVAADRLVYRKSDPKLPEIGARLALTRRALDLTRFQMARLLGTNMPTWGTYEAGTQRIPPDQALKLSAYGIPLAWIYDGKVANLPPHLRAKFGNYRPDPAREYPGHSPRPMVLQDRLQSRLRPR